VIDTQTLGKHASKQPLIDDVPWIWLPQGDLPAVHSRYTHRSSALQCEVLAVFHPCLWPLKAPGSTLGEGRQTSRQPA